MTYDWDRNFVAFFCLESTSKLSVSFGEEEVVVLLNLCDVSSSSKSRWFLGLSFKSSYVLFYSDYFYYNCSILFPYVLENPELLKCTLLFFSGVLFIKSV
jgi:hypothetical protein